MEAYVGTICAFGFNYAPYQWALCQGQIMAIQQNTALFSLLGTQYGGNGTTNFGLPNLMSKVAIGVGNNGQSTYEIGEDGGSTTVTMMSSNLPSHSHGLSLAFGANNRSQDRKNPAGAFPAPNGSGGNVTNYNSASSNGTYMGNPTITLGTTGGAGNPISIVDPNLVLNYCICLYGIFPPRQ